MALALPQAAMLWDQTMSVLDQAVLNNAQWCDAVCRAHAAPGHFTPAAWVNTNNTPPLYPNMVTTTGDDVASQFKAVEWLIEKRPDFSSAVKDSFSKLDLKPLGFTELFDAQRFARAPAPVPENLLGKASPWQQLSTGPELVAWEKAWREAGGHEDILEAPLFPTKLLNEPGVIFLASKSAGGIKAGAVAYAVSGVIGMTNFFSKPGEAASHFAACLNSLYFTHPTSIAVGYEHEDTLEEYAGLNLQSLGPLRVWMR
jgi:hypothetical protein